MSPVLRVNTGPRMQSGEQPRQDMSRCNPDKIKLLPSSALQQCTMGKFDSWSEQKSGRIFFLLCQELKESQSVSIHHHHKLTILHLSSAFLLALGTWVFLEFCLYHGSLCNVGSSVIDHEESHTGELIVGPVLSSNKQWRPEVCRIIFRVFIWTWKTPIIFANTRTRKQEVQQLSTHLKYKCLF